MPELFEILQIKSAADECIWCYHSPHVFPCKTCPCTPYKDRQIASRLLELFMRLTQINNFTNGRQ